MTRIKLFPGILRTRNEESTLIACLLLLSFLMGIALTFFFTVSISTFLIEFTAGTLPYVYLLSGLMSYTIWAIYQKLSSRLAFSTLIITALGFLLAATALLTVLSSIHPGKWLSFMLLVWVSSFLFIKNVCFWGMASKLFNMSQGKRLFGFIGSGEVLSNIAGFFAVPFLLRVINTTGLLGISIAALLLALSLVFFMTRKYASMFAASLLQHETKQPDQRNKFEKDRFFLRLLIFSIFPVFTFYLVDYLFLNQAHDQFSDVSVLANFMGYFLGAVSIAELLFKSLVFGKVLKHYGVKAGVLCLPLSLLFSSVLTLLAGLIWDYDSYILFSIIALTKLLERSVNNGIHAPGMQLLYQPVRTAGRAGFQSKVEGISSALGNIAAGGLILLLSSFDITGAMVYNTILLLTLSGWIVTVAPLYSAYKQKLHDALQRYNYRQRSERKLHSGKDILIRSAGSANKAVALASTRLLQALEQDTASAGQDMNGTHSGFPHTLHDLEHLLSRTPSLAVKHRILEIYSKTRTEDARSLLLNKLVYPEREVQMKTVDLLYSLEYTASSGERTGIKQKITEVVGIFAWLNASILDLEKYAPADALLRSLKAERKEYAVMLYMLLSFVYGYATIELIKNNLQDKNDAESFIYALEVAANTLEEDMKALVFPLFENIAPEKGLEKLNTFFPQQRLSVVNRVIAILYKDYARITLWTKVNALVVLTEFYAHEEARQEIIACLFHEYTEIREIALRCIMERSSSELTGIVLSSPKLSTLDLNKLPQQSTFSKVLLLKDTPLFHVTSEHKLPPIASLFDLRKLHAGECMTVADHCIIVLSGTLLFHHGLTTMTVTAPFTFIQNVNPMLHMDHAFAQEECEILICDKPNLFHLIVENPALTRNLLKFATENDGDPKLQC